ncbi:virulence RhuM family protein [Campylobacter sp. RM15925]|uniref:virulence RhuM family protein n=1 Tax=Campylobacter sp. RM15925 TaxID=1705724 RepID=UPI00201E44B9|nr:virulence RhuM family protein [Campylobacter sp. RM15925]
MGSEMIDIKEQNFIIYSTSDNKINIQILADRENETIWLNQKQIAEIFETSKQNVSYHIKNILDERELDESTVKEILTVRPDGTKLGVKHYNLDMIIAVGYRINSVKATHFRQWATSTLKEYIIKGFVLDDERLKQGNNVFNKDYFKELLERIRAIRASEKLFYEKVRDLFALSVDYDKTSQTAKNFFANIQNKLEYAITKKTSAEIIKERADHTKPNMGLMTWSGSSRGKDLIKQDVYIAKNYLDESEISKLNRLTNMLLDYVETQAEQGIAIQMKDWDTKIDGFLTFNGYEILKGFGKISKESANTKADDEYLKFQELKQNEDFKQDIKKIINNHETKN